MEDESLRLTRRPPEKSIDTNSKSKTKNKRNKKK